MKRLLDQHEQAGGKSRASRMENTLSGDLEGIHVSIEDDNRVRRQPDTSC
jgi:hypothetical protein